MKTRTLMILTGIILLAGCSGDHFITDRNYRRKVSEQFSRQKELACNREQQLFGVFGEDLTTREREALEFLIAYSSLNDLADYDGGYFLKNVRASFEARDIFSWGQQIPEVVFRHFVLPVRVNNENLDSSRWVFLAELKDRIRNLTMEQAVLEVNHWCHEKVTYRGTDGRTSSPLATVKTAFGRCGEESTFTVAALRSVGIPARQCYTPRWAHSDDNHAWVEVWVDGKWRFIGACEPDVALDMAWFTRPAKRAMLVNTTVFGDYEGPEQVLLKDPLFTRINVLANYAETREITAIVRNMDGRPADGATVEFQLYNYAEFYPLHKAVTGPDGRCSFITGRGDLLAWAAGNGRYGFSKIDVRSTDTVVVILDKEPGQSWSVELDMVPPAEPEQPTGATDSARKDNDRRLAFEDGLRTAYEATFIDSVKSFRYARLVGLNADTLWDFLHRSRGNWRTLTNFITMAPTGLRYILFSILGNISEKDLRDIDSAVLNDILMNATKYQGVSGNRADFDRYILSPRVDNEYLRPHRELFQASFEPGFIGQARKDPALLIQWTRENITLNRTANYSRAPLTPKGTFELKVADRHSADIFFVALCRSFGIPARLDPATRVPQYLSGEKWIDVELGDREEEAGIKGSVTLTSPASNAKRPEYTIHYTLQSYRDGFFKTLDYEGSPLVSTFPFTVDVPAGPCLLVSGSRMPDGTVLAMLEVFNISPDSNVTRPVILRNSPMQRKVLGTVENSLADRYKPHGWLVAWIDQGQEPSRHLIADMKAKKQLFGAWKGRMDLVFPDEAKLAAFKTSEGSQMPSGLHYQVAATYPLQPDILTGKTGKPAVLPVVAWISPTGNILYLSEGYRIGTADELLTLMK